MTQPLWNATALRKVKRARCCERCQRRSEAAETYEAFGLENAAWCNGCLRCVLAAGLRVACVINREERR
jgi:hypothetical protein